MITKVERKKNEKKWLRTYIPVTKLRHTGWPKKKRIPPKSVYCPQFPFEHHKNSPPVGQTYVLHILKVLKVYHKNSWILKHLMKIES